MPRIVDPNKRKLEITYGLWQVIYEHGVGAVTLRAVAAAANISLGRVQHYFSTKEELITFGCQAMVDSAAQQEVTEGTAQDLIETLCSTLRDGRDFRLGAAVWTAYQAHAVVNPAIAEIITEAEHQRTAQVERLLSHTTTRTGQELADLAVYLIALAEGLQQRVLITRLPMATARGIIITAVSELQQD